MEQSKKKFSYTYYEKAFIKYILNTKFRTHQIKNINIEIKIFKKYAFVTKRYVLKTLVNLFK